MTTGTKLISNLSTLFNPEIKKAIPNNISNPSQSRSFNDLTKFTKRIKLPATKNKHPYGRKFAIKKKIQKNIKKTAKPIAPYTVDLSFELLFSICFLLNLIF